MTYNDQKFAAEDIYSILLSNKDTLPGEYVPLDFEELEMVCNLSKKVLAKDGIVINVEAPINVIGDIHGQYSYLWEYLTDMNKRKEKYLFLGDYVDRGPNSIECIVLLLCLKILHRKRFFLIRGNHESEETTKKYGLYDECIQKYESKGEELYKLLLGVFEYLPLAAIISKDDQKIFCVHGGLSPNFTKISQFDELKFPIKIPDAGFIRDILWSDPNDEIDQYEENPQRAGEYIFGLNAVKEFLTQNGFNYIFRAHQLVQYGYEFPFLKKNNDKSLLTIFSSPNYYDKFRNSGAMVTVGDDMSFSFKTVETKLFHI